MRRRRSEAPALLVISDFANAPTLWAISGHNSVAIRAGPDDEKPPSVMMVTSARHVGRYQSAGLVGGMGYVQEDRDYDFGSSASDAGYCLSARGAESSGDRSYDDYHQG
jgi:hypothetical protein